MLALFEKGWKHEGDVELIILFSDKFCKETRSRPPH